MQNQTHAHDVIDLIHHNNAQFTRETLEFKLAESFGPNTRYYACTEDNMDALRIIEFLLERNKIHEDQGLFSVNQSNLCQH